jgi:adenylate cyclase
MQVSPEAAREALRSILVSPRFSASRRLSRLLTFLVEANLSGAVGQLKGYTVGVEVFDKPTDFDPTIDPTVRVHMGRLRQALTQYYGNEGCHDDVVIAFEKASFSPVLALRSAQLATENGASDSYNKKAHWTAIPATLQMFGSKNYMRAATLAILLAVAFGALSWDTISRPAQLPNGLTLAATAAYQFKPKIRVFVGTDAGVFDPNFLAEFVGGLAKYSVLSVEVVDREVPYSSVLDRRAVYTVQIRTSDSYANAFVVLTDNARSQVVWASRISKLASRSLAETVLVVIMQQRGPLAVDLYGRRDIGDELSCIVKASFAVSQRDYRPALMHDLRKCLRVIVAGPGKLPVAIAFLAHLHLPPFDPQSLPTVALELAREAVQMAPTNAIARRSMMLAYINAGHPDLGLREGKLAVANNPLNPDVRAAYGLRLAAAGHYQEGVAELTGALEVLLPGDPCWDLGLFLGYIGMGDFVKAEEAALRLPVGDAPIFAISRIAAHLATQRNEAAKDEFADLKKRNPKLAQQPMLVFKDLALENNLKDQLAAHLARLTTL